MQATTHHTRNLLKMAMGKAFDKMSKHHLEDQDGWERATTSNFFNPLREASDHQKPLLNYLGEHTDRWLYPGMHFDRRPITE